jgi:hypothetical protein
VSDTEQRTQTLITRAAERQTHQETDHDRRRGLGNRRHCSQRDRGRLIEQQLNALDIPVILEPGDAWVYMGAGSAVAVKVPLRRLADAQEALR